MLATSGRFSSSQPSLRPDQSISVSSISNRTASMRRRRGRGIELGASVLEEGFMRVLLVKFCQGKRAGCAEDKQDGRGHRSPAGNAGGDNGQRRADDNAQYEMIHDRVGLVKQPGDQLGEDEDTDDHAEDDGNDDREVKLPDATGHRLV